MKDNMISDWELERFLLGELPKRRMRDLEERLASEESLRKRIDALKDDNRDILDRFPAETAVPRILCRVEELRRREETAAPLPRAWRFRPLFGAVSIFVFAAMVVSAIFLFRNVVSDSSYGGATQAGSRIKGSGGVDLNATRLYVYRKNGNGVEALESGSAAKPGDLLQMAYVAGPASHGIVFSIDGKGVVTLHYPESPSSPTILQRQKVIFLPHAYELDDAPDFERFFFLASEKELNAADLLEKAKRLAVDPLKAKGENLELPGTIQQQTLLILKGAVR